MKRLLGSIIVVSFFVILSFAEGPTGIRGFVYNHTDSLARNQLYHIYIIRVDEQGSASYYYQSGTSYWITNDTYGLVTGHWAIYGETIENGVHYYSPVYYHLWSPGQVIDQDIHCTNASPPKVFYMY